MRDGDEVIGALNIYSREPREWSDEDIAVAVVLADVATGYVLNAAKLHDQEQLSEQLQQYRCSNMRGRPWQTHLTPPGCEGAQTGVFRRNLA